MKTVKMVVVCISVLAMAAVAMAGTLDDVRAKGYIDAGINGSLFGFGMPDDKGEMKGLDVDTAKAIAAAVFGDASKVKFTALTAVQRLTCCAETPPRPCPGKPSPA
jgi:general L-amino acid transport system substrate-binding protein